MRAPKRQLVDVAERLADSQPLAVRKFDACVFLARVDTVDFPTAIKVALAGLCEQVVAGSQRRR
ncbi:MAG: hypothetical protein IKY61_06005, partial [Thermoguttaceae bacterium]|nr:hypothetical protein [Thermoguttaceae bacterium]